MRGQAVASTFRSVAALARPPPGLADPAGQLGAHRQRRLRCAQLTARQVTGKVDPQWISEAQELWRKNGKPLPDSCDAVFTCCRHKAA